MQVTKLENELRFLDGPAADQTIRMFVEPTKHRWFCRRDDYTWWSSYRPPADLGTECFRYKMIGSVVRKDSVLFHYELEAE